MSSFRKVEDVMKLTDGQLDEALLKCEMDLHRGGNRIGYIKDFGYNLSNLKAEKKRRMLAENKR